MPILCAEVDNNRNVGPSLSGDGGGLQARLDKLSTAVWAWTNEVRPSLAPQNQAGCHQCRAAFTSSGWTRYAMPTMTMATTARTISWVVAGVR